MLSANFTAKKPLLIKISAVVLLVLLCCNLPSLLFWPLCLKQDRDIPPNTEVLISACNKRLTTTAVPGGEVLFVARYSAYSAYVFDDVYLLDLRTGKKKYLSDDDLLILGRAIFLNSELVWLEGTPGGTSRPDYRPHYILDLTNGKRYELTDLSNWVDQSDPPDYVPYFQAAEQVFIHHKNNRAIALPPNFRQNPEGGVILYKNRLQSDFKNGELLESIMRDLGVKYEIVDFSLQYTDILSPTGRYVARGDGIYFSGTSTRAVNLDSMYYFKGWYYDDSGVVIREPGYHLINLGSAFGSSYEYFYIPSPVLKLRLPAP